MKRLYTVYDVVANTIIGGIIQEAADAPAMRAFHDALSAKGSLLAQHPADYTLLCIGQINDQGIISDEQTNIELVTRSPQIIATGKAWLALTTQPEQLEILK